MPAPSRTPFDTVLMTVAAASSIALVVAVALVVGEHASSMVWPLIAAVLLVASLTIWSARRGISGIRRPGRDV
jgi:hypothetical protein